MTVLTESLHHRAPPGPISDTPLTTFPASGIAGGGGGTLSERSSSSRLLERDASQSPSLHEVSSSSRLLERDSSQSSYGSMRLLERDSSQSSHGSAQDGETRVPDSIAAFAGRYGE